MPEATMKLGGLGGSEHAVGDWQCTAGWCGGSYPRMCGALTHSGAGVCTGLVHAEFGEEDADCNYTLDTRCDICGEAE